MKSLIALCWFCVSFVESLLDLSRWWCRSTKGGGCHDAVLKDTRLENFEPFLVRRTDAQGEYTVAGYLHLSINRAGCFWHHPSTRGEHVLVTYGISTCSQTCPRTCNHYVTKRYQRQDDWSTNRTINKKRALQTPTLHYFALGSMVLKGAQGFWWAPCYFMDRNVPGHHHYLFGGRGLFNSMSW
jgi:hypothetical protein